jgi:hypothetical protein
LLALNIQAAKEEEEEKVQSNVGSQVPKANPTPIPSVKLPDRHHHFLRNKRGSVCIAASLAAHAPSIVVAEP